MALWFKRLLIVVMILKMDSGVGAKVYTGTHEEKMEQMTRDGVWYAAGIFWLMIALLIAMLIVSIIEIIIRAVRKGDKDEKRRSGEKSQVV